MKPMNNLQWYDPSAPAPVKKASADASPALVQEKPTKAPPPPAPAAAASPEVAGPTPQEATTPTPPPSPPAPVACAQASPEEAPEKSPEGEEEQMIDVPSTNSAEIDKPQTSATAAPAPARELSPLEAARSVEEAVKAKEALVKLSLQKAKEDMAAKRKELEERRLREERELAEQEQELQRLQVVATGDGVDTARVQRLRNAIEEAGREMRYLERDVASKLSVMQRATEAYCTAQENLATKRDARKRLEEEMLDLMLSAGKAKDEKLNEVLQKI